MTDLHDFLTNTVPHLKKEEMASVIGPDPEAFHSLFKISYSGNMPSCFRAAWLMDYLAELHPWLAEEYIEIIWPEIINRGHSDGVTRCSLRLLTRYEIPEKFQGEAFDLSLEWMETKSVPVAIKDYSMEILLKIATLYPELVNEIIPVIEKQIPNNSVAFKARAKQVMGRLRSSGTSSI